MRKLPKDFLKANLRQLAKGLPEENLVLPLTTFGLSPVYTKYVWNPHYTAWCLPADEKERRGRNTALTVETRGREEKVTLTTSSSEEWGLGSSRSPPGWGTPTRPLVLGINQETLGGHLEPGEEKEEAGEVQSLRFTGWDHERSAPPYQHTPVFWTKSQKRKSPSSFKRNAKRQSAWLKTKAKLEFTEDEEVSTDQDQAESKLEAESVTIEHVDFKIQRERIDIVFKADTDTGPNETMYKNLILSVPGQEGCHGIAEKLIPGGLQANYKENHMTVAEVHSPACWHGDTGLQALALALAELWLKTNT